MQAAHLKPKLALLAKQANVVCCYNLKLQSALCCTEYLSVFSCSYMCSGSCCLYGTNLIPGESSVQNLLVGHLRVIFNVFWKLINFCAGAMRGMKINLVFKSCSCTATCYCSGVVDLNSKHQELSLDKCHFTLERHKAEWWIILQASQMLKQNPVSIFPLNDRKNNKWCLSGTQG